MNRIKQHVLLIVAVVSLVFAPCAANAFTLLQCDSLGGVVPNTSLYDADIKNHTGECMYEGEPVVQHVFSHIICDFVVVLNAIMGKMYCGINYMLINIVGIALTLYLTLYGAQVLMGLAQISARDSLARLLKISFIYVFATKAEYGISFIFSFFIGFISDASKSVINVLSAYVPVEGDGVCHSVPLNGDNMMSMFNFLDYLICHAFIGPGSTVSLKVLGLFLAMALTVTPVFMLFQWWFSTTFWTLLRTIVGFLKSLAAIAFLITLSPIFLTFFLFTTTTYLFENWLRYLISFSVQIVLIFAIIVFWIMAMYKFVGFFNDLAKLIFLYVPTTFYGPVADTSSVWAICPPVYGTDSKGEPTAVCGRGSDGYYDVDYGGQPINVRCGKPGTGGEFDATPPASSDEAGTFYPPSNMLWECDNQELVPPSKIFSQGDFLYYVIFHLFTLLLITYSFSILLERAQDIARSLSGSPKTPNLLPGWGAHSLGSLGGFKTPPGASRRPSDGTPSAKLAQEFHQLISNR